MTPISRPGHLVNRTPHPITFYVDDKPVLTVPPTDPPLRVPESTVTVAQVEVIPGAAVVPLVEVATQPLAEAGSATDDASPHLLIVSREVARAYPERRDLVFPQDFVRDEEGRPIGCRALGRFT